MVGTAWHTHNCEETVVSDCLISQSVSPVTSLFYRSLTYSSTPFSACSPLAYRVVLNWALKGQRLPSIIIESLSLIPT